MDASSPAAAVAEPSDVVDTTRRFVTFTAGDDVYAVDLAPVQEIIRVPAVVPVPLAPPSLDGLANLRGRVLPLLNLRRAVGLPARETDEATRALVIDAGQPIGVVVDRVSSVVAVPENSVEPVDPSFTSALGDLVHGVLKNVGGHAVLMVLDVPQLLARELSVLQTAATRTQRTRATAALSESSTNTTNVDAADDMPFVSFSLGGEEYALDVRHVREILRVPERIAHVPNAAAHLVGVTTVRESLLPLVCLRRMLGLDAGARDERSRIVVIGDATRSVGLVVDAVHEVMRVDASRLDAVPVHLREGGNPSYVQAIGRLDDGRRLVSILDAQAFLLADATGASLSTTTSTQPDTMDQVDAARGEDEQVVVLRLGAQEFGVPIEAVQEIVRVPETLTEVPHAPPFVQGVMNLRGAVLPVLDLRRRLGLDPIERSDAQRVLVFTVDGTRTGFIVDAVLEVLRVPRGAVSDAPLLSSAQQAVLGRIINLEHTQRIVQLLTPSALLDASASTAIAA
jgi:purine-binding chemotaxis protein CheW